MRSILHTAAPWVWLLALTVDLLLDDPRRRFFAHMLCWSAAAGAWCLMLRSPPRRSFWLGCLPYGLALLAAPAFSEDVFRYVFEGRAAWAMGPLFPFIVSPADAPHAGVPTALLDEAWLRINHPELPTIYPPLAQMAFMAAALSPAPMLFLKALNVGSSLGAALLLERAGLPGWRWVWLCPLVVLESVREGHVDGLTLLFGAVAVTAWKERRAWVGHLGFALSALTKVVGGVGLVVGARRDLRGLALGFATLALLGWPFWSSGGAGAQGSLAYAGRWHGGDGVHALIHAGAELLLGGSWARVGGLTVTARDLARGAVAAAFAAGLALRLRRRPTPAEVPLWTGQLILLALLLSPTFYPWYALAALPFAAMGAGPSCAAALAATAPLLHHASYVELLTGVWRPSPWPSVVVHVAAWWALLQAWVRNPGLGAGRR